jgi:2-methylaconitate cis-trans-isomerase PrpF
VYQELELVLMRGGTSKGVFVHDRDLPSAVAERDAFILALMGSPDPLQIDGLGGARSSTSKLVSVTGSQRPGVDVEYLFAQVGVDVPAVDYAGNCGNLTAAVGPYAIDEGLVEATEPSTRVRLYNRNTDSLINVQVPVSGGRFDPAGDFELSGVPGTGSEIVTEYLNPAGAVLGSALPTGNPVEWLEPADGEPVAASLVDVAGPAVFVRAEDAGTTIDLSPDAANADQQFLGRLESIRAAAAVRLGLAADQESATRTMPALPRLALIGAAREGQSAPHQLAILATSMQRVHHACPLTVLMCAAAALYLPGTLPQQTGRRSASGRTSIAHPKGIATVRVSISCSTAQITSVCASRTARRLLAGRAYVRRP